VNLWPGLLVKRRTASCYVSAPILNHSFVLLSVYGLN
jgi:hypothetical protein